MNTRKLCFLAFFLLLVTISGIRANAQNVALKTNLLYDAFLNVNGGVEIGLAPRWTLDVNAYYTVGHYLTNANGSTGWFSHRRVIGFATAFRATL